MRSFKRKEWPVTYFEWIKFRREVLVDKWFELKENVIQNEILSQNSDFLDFNFIE